ncbi:hypothetical protein HXX76_000261 [Chlamydomonas incerta]|uniref:Glutaredoxin domain-containing protein n=1 Tax=Chlamydomonas incerta TaxID=51695 RepID=A0A835WE86_CHLIN|nr:hypothetical protein HXX76_000261 [Chlamydomonas incerta]|eukprot:KAG2445651.1 hypothetical protein HXX76_000261 [Chlamydomonas incerta]
MATKLDSIKETVAKNKVVVYSKTHCPYCMKAKSSLNQFLQPSQYTVIELDGRADMDEMQDALRELTGARSVPRVFVGGKFLGGGDDTAAAASNGTLKKMLQEAGAL